MKTSICHLASHLNHSLFLEAVADFLDSEKYVQSFVFLNPTEGPLQLLLAKRGHSVEWVPYNGKRNLPAAIWKLRQILTRSRPDIVHTHLADASLAGLIAAKSVGIENRVHTRHHASEAHTYYPHGVYYDRLINRLSKRIMATTEIVKETLIKLEGVDPEKISLINYGYDLSEFDGDGAKKKELNEKYGLSEHHPVVGVISRFVEWKGVHYIIPAFAKLMEKYPKAKLVLANATGNYKNEIQKLLNKFLSADQYVEIEFEPYVFDLYDNFDLFVHVPIGRDFEAFGQTYIEALYKEIPSVFTLSGIANEFIVDDENAIVVPYRNSQAIFEAMVLLVENDCLRDQLTRAGKTQVKERFGGQRLAIELDRFYSSL